MKVYLSYSHKDGRAAEVISDALERAGFSVWSERLVAAGSNIGQEAGAALDNADALVVLISPDSAESPWIRHEIQYGLGNLRFEGRLIPVILEPTPNIPWILQKLPSVQVQARGVEDAAEQVVAMLREQDRIARNHG